MIRFLSINFKRCELRLQSKHNLNQAGLFPTDLSTF